MKIDQDAYGRVPFAIGEPLVAPEFLGNPSKNFLFTKGVDYILGEENFSDHMVNTSSADLGDFLSAQGMHLVTVSEDEKSEVPYGTGADD